MKEFLLPLKVTLLTAAFVAVSYGIYHLKTQGMGQNTQRALGVHPNGGIKAKVLINHRVNNPSAPSHTEASTK